jgi:hypothetical protein
VAGGGDEKKDGGRDHGQIILRWNIISRILLSCCLVRAVLSEAAAGSIYMTCSSYS